MGILNSDDLRDLSIAAAEAVGVEPFRWIPDGRRVQSTQLWLEEDSARCAELQWMNGLIVHGHMLGVSVYDEMDDIEYIAPIAQESILNFLSQDGKFDESNRPLMTRVAILRALVAMKGE